MYTVLLDDPYQVGKVTPEITEDARTAGLSEAGIAALQSGDLATYKRELDAMPQGRVWRDHDGYTLWYKAAGEPARGAEERRLKRRLRTLTTCYACRQALATPEAVANVRAHMAKAGKGNAGKPRPYVRQVARCCGRMAKAGQPCPKCGKVVAAQG